MHDIMDDMQTTVFVEKTHQYVREKFADESNGHDYWHIHRVWQMARRIAEQEGRGDMLVVELAALLHDIADWKFHDGDEKAGPKAARAWLETLQLDEDKIQHIENIVRHISFKGAGVRPKLATIEGQIVHDADKLDAIGAIGIARTIAYGSSKGWTLYDPAKQVVEHETAESFMRSEGPVINHFYERTLLMKDRMFTQTGRQIAEHRHAYVEEFLREFYAEYDGEK